ncbi:alpha-latrotoxin-Lhe1a-like isoform X2 [Lineus longissimus]|uniref:alpha-latrotoxin-Lhe1a-like isoform X2 n=1 Tax=Lineus longissimus TaxID=88925 RepID=UPI002B4C83EB
MDEYLYVQNWVDTQPVGPRRLDPDIHVTFQLPSSSGSDSQNLYRNQGCNWECFESHLNTRCPGEYDAYELAVSKDLDLVVQYLEKVDGRQLHPVNDKTVQRYSEHQRDAVIERPVQVVRPYHDRLATQIARETVDKFGKDFIDHGCNTLMHQCVLQNDPLAIFIYADRGVPVNAQNEAGDTALHLAVRTGRRELVRGLLQCGADITIRNKLGQCPLDETEGDVKELLEEYSPGLVNAIQRQQYQTIQKLLRLWCSLQTVINKEGQTALQLAETLAQKDQNAWRCLQIAIKDNLATNEFIHNVKAEKTEDVRLSLKRGAGMKININIRYRNKKGKTPLVCAIERQNTELVKVLLNAGAAVTGLRVQENDEIDTTVPLLFVALARDMPLEIVKAVCESGTQDLFEKNSQGYNGLHVLIGNCASIKTIEWVNSFTNGRLLSQKDMQGMIPRELAVVFGREDVFKYIDSFVAGMNDLDKLFLAVDFYGVENFKHAVQEKETLNMIKACESRAKELFEAVATGDVKTAASLNKANYRDKNGFTALIKAIVYNQYDTAKHLLVDRPILKSLSDNCNRYPLHYAYALPESVGYPFVRLILEKTPEDFEKTYDKDGLIPADYINRRKTDKVNSMINSALRLDIQGKVKEKK